jgi:hypothetical protein
MLLPLLLVLAPAAAQESAPGNPVLARGPAALTLDGEMRLRLESRDGALPLAGADSETASSGRFRFGLLAELDERFAAYAQFQHLVMDEGLDSEEAVHQAFFAWRDAPFGANLRAGRAELGFGSGLIADTDDWNGAGRAFDGLFVEREGRSYRALLFWTQPAEEQAVPVGVDQDFGGLWFECEFAGGLTLDAYAVTRDDRSGSLTAFEDETFGARLRGALPAGGGWSAELAAQTGEHGPLDAGGLLAAAEGALPFASSGEAAVGLLYASGDDDASDGDQDAFAPLYDARHAILGAADLVAPSNVLDLWGRARWDLDGNWNAVAALHWMRLADSSGAVPVAGVSASGDSELAQELDLWVAGRLMPQLDLNLGLAQFWAGDAILGGDDQLWIFAQALVRF